MRATREQIIAEVVCCAQYLLVHSPTQPGSDELLQVLIEGRSVMPREAWPVPACASESGLEYAKNVLRVRCPFLAPLLEQWHTWPVPDGT